ncbi:hypothetical protein GOBAR_AA09615 [Gossypium barbadense]|uniref:non-specific serine/threonine protein kinase n=1 Tax=Gossypium barbadense TaxID=3634 RepID=A0A2P5Y619_GOSBA|nr:hypothetical protein GOBAR_AA09615 [Gossypium barbadense]
MSVYDAAFVNTELSKPTSIFGLRLWVVIGILLGSLIVLTLFLLSLCLTTRRKSRRHQHLDPTPPISKEIQEIVHHPPAPDHHHAAPPVPEIQVGLGKVEHRVVFSSGESRGPTSAAASVSETASFGSGSVGPEVSHLGWGRWYTLRELELATNGLCEENVIGEGGYGIVYSGVLTDGTKVAVKNLLNNMLVYEYVDNGNLEQWVHGDVGDVSPLTWEIRMNIIVGTAKGLAYLHEGLEPKVVHRDVKSSNILLDRQWNPKVSDFGLAKLLCSENSYVTTRVMGTFGYVAPEYACTGMLNEKSDVYSFGILIMEIISGRSPVDYSRPPGELNKVMNQSFRGQAEKEFKVEVEAIGRVRHKNLVRLLGYCVEGAYVNLVEWLKTKVGNRKSEEVVDPKLPEMPASKALKRVLLVALKCVDPDATKRPKMGHIIHMLEADDLLFHDERRIAREQSNSRSDDHRTNRNSAKVGERRFDGASASDTSEGDSGRNYHQPTRWR